MVAVTASGLALAVLLLSSALLYSSFCIIPAIILLPLSVKYSGLLAEHLVFKGWSGLVAAILEVIYRVKIVISGDIEKLSKTRPTLIIMNHRCRFDWLFLWCYLVRLGCLSNERITLKSGLAKIPFIGWTMDLCMFIFLHRKWSSDKENITDILNFYRQSSLPVQLLIFPEGTDLSESNKKKDREFAEKNELAINKYTMHPRLTGFIHCMKVLRAKKAEVDICDITVGYVGKITQGEREILKGELPNEIHFHVKSTPYHQVSLLSDEELGTWLKETWKDKENRLKEFYQNNSFNTSPVYKDSWLVTIQLLGFLAYGYICYCLFLYYLPWTLLAVIVFGSISYIVVLVKGGWSRIILDWTKNKKSQ